MSYVYNGSFYVSEWINSGEYARYRSPALNTDMPFNPTRLIPTAKNFERSHSNRRIDPTYSHV